MPFSSTSPPTIVCLMLLASPTRLFEPHVAPDFTMCEIDGVTRLALRFPRITISRALKEPPAKIVTLPLISMPLSSHGATTSISPFKTSPGGIERQLVVCAVAKDVGRHRTTMSERYAAISCLARWSIYLRGGCKRRAVPRRGVVIALCQSSHGRHVSLRAKSPQNLCPDHGTDLHQAGGREEPLDGLNPIPTSWRRLIEPRQPLGKAAPQGQGS